MQQVTEPPKKPQRFDTMFYICCLSEVPRAKHDETETVQHTVSINDCMPIKTTETVHHTVSISDFMPIKTTETVHHTVSISDCMPIKTTETVHHTVSISDCMPIKTTETGLFLLKSYIWIVYSNKSYTFLYLKITKLRLKHLAHVVNTHNSHTPNKPI